MVESWARSKLCEHLRTAFVWKTAVWCGRPCRSYFSDLGLKINNEYIETWLVFTIIVNVSFAVLLRWTRNLLYIHGTYSIHHLRWEHGPVQWVSCLGITQTFMSLVLPGWTFKVFYAWNVRVHGDLGLSKPSVQVFSWRNLENHSLHSHKTTL